MEETGHYYTVYMTSLAVGFRKDIAQAHATIAQMPDEVGWLDASNLHKTEMFGWKEFNLRGISGGFWGTDYNKVPVTDAHRVEIEYGVHSLVNGRQKAEYQSSDFQLRVTETLLRQQNPLSVEFCLLLHRLGDNFAHRIMGDESNMYSIYFDTTFSSSARGYAMGHAVDIHDPDYPDLRQDLFYKYLKELYTILHEKLWNSPRFYKSFHGSQKPISYKQLERLYKWIFETSKPPKPYDWDNAAADVDGYNAFAKEVAKNLWYSEYRANIIKNIRSSCETVLNVKMDPYKPEEFDNQTFFQFIAAHSESAKLMNLNERTLTNAIHDIFKRTYVNTPPSKD